MEEYTPEQWAKWASYKSNKDRWIEQEEARLDEIQEDSTSMEEKLEALDILETLKELDIQKSIQDSLKK